MSAFDIAKKYLSPEKPEAFADITEGQIIAVEICSTVLEAHVWIAFDDSFDPKDSQAIFYVHELPMLNNKTPEQLRALHEKKLKVPGIKVRP